MADDDIANGKGGFQRRKIRKDGWTIARRRTFLEEFAATGNARYACARVGLSEGAAYRLRLRDREFARQYDEALDTAEVRLESLLVEFTETRGKAVDLAMGEPPPADLTNFNPELALKILGRRRSSRGGGVRRTTSLPHLASKEQLVRSILRLIANLDKRQARRAAR